MNILADVFKELFKMFVADFRLTMATLASVALVAVLLGSTQITPVAGGILLLSLCLAVLFEAVLREAIQRAKNR
jgi:hypothetical protein